ncbi:MAG: cache domain-containing protein, partial [Burkholderiales bacterium]|nr:cache domain-containing protein [Burkholderiales bacterium]
MRFMKLLSLNISKKLWLLAASAAIGMGALTLAIMWSEKVLMIEERQASVRQAVESAYGILDFYHGQATKGAMPEDEAKRSAIAVIKTLRYSGSEYFWINDMQPRMIMHPIRPELDGKDLSDNKDPTGKRLFMEFVATVKANGAGFVNYMWPKPGSQDPVPKVSYVKGFTPWGWLIGSGVYIDTIEAAYWRRLIELSIGAFVLSGIILGICIKVARSIIRPLEQAVHIARTVAAGDLTTRIRVERDDETGQLLESLKDMSDSLIRIVAEVRHGTESISTASSQIASGNMDLSSRTEHQASSLEETASSMEELTSTVRQNADNARQANQ